eukprot:scaffold527_cov368-Prasinococcus_capsulatus_cf.AAC.55
MLRSPCHRCSARLGGRQARSSVVAPSRTGAAASPAAWELPWLRFKSKVSPHAYRSRPSVYAGSAPQAAGVACFNTYGAARHALVERARVTRSWTTQAKPFYQQARRLGAEVSQRECVAPLSRSPRGSCAAASFDAGPARAVSA